MKPRIRGIQIPRPCTEDWEAMDRAGGQERYCSRCAHCVTDFTAMTDREVLDRVLASEGRICGRFTRDQLDRVNLSLRPDPQPSTWRSALLALAGLACTVPPVTATTRQPPAAETAAPAPEDKAPQEPATVQERQTGTTPILKGRVLNDSDGQPLDGATVGVLKTDLSTTSDAEGWFLIDLGLLEDLPPQIRLVITRNDYHPIFLTLSTTEVSPDLTIRLQEVKRVFMGVVVQNVQTVRKPLWRTLSVRGHWRRPERRDPSGPLFRSPQE